ncbi:MAG: substrate-binding domain-containing protein [Caldilineaceae bacterium]
MNERGWLYLLFKPVAVVCKPKKLVALYFYFVSYAHVCIGYFVENRLKPKEKNRVLHKKLGWLIVIVMLAGLLLAACAPAATPAQSNATTTQVKAEPVAQSKGAGGAGVREICIIGGADAFFAVVKNGADAAGAAVVAAGSHYTWIPLPNYDNIGPDMVKLIEQAVAQKCTGLAVPVWDGAAEGPAIKAAVDKGINVFMYNSGLPLLQDGSVPAHGYFGTDEHEAGLAAGKAFVAHGSKHLICVNTQPGAVNWQQRCGGAIEAAKAGGMKAEELTLPAENFGNAAAISAAVQAKLTADPTIDAVVNGSAADSDAVAETLSSLGVVDKVALGSWDVSKNILDRIASGKQVFAVDQQGWLQGWYAVSHTWFYDQYAILPATNVILTGPALITKDNVATVQLAVGSGQR